MVPVSKLIGPGALTLKAVERAPCGLEDCTHVHVRWPHDWTNEHKATPWLPRLLTCLQCMVSTTESRIQQLA